MHRITLPRDGAELRTGDVVAVAQSDLPAPVHPGELVVVHRLRHRPHYAVVEATRATGTLGAHVVLRLGDPVAAAHLGGADVPAIEELDGVRDVLAGLCELRRAAEGCSLRCATCPIARDDLRVASGRETPRR